MKPSQKCINLIKQFEGLCLKAYICPAGKVSIGYGATFYEDNKLVTIGDLISIKRAEDLLKFHADIIAAKLPKLNLEQNQFDAIISFVYNVGIGNFLKSTLYRIMKQNPNDDLIGDEFMKWTKARVKGELKTLKGLINRRKAEKNLYYEEN